MLFWQSVRSQDSLVNAVTELQTLQLDLNSQLGQGFFLFTTTSKLAMGLTQPPIKWVPGTLSAGVKWPGCEA